MSWKNHIQTAERKGLAAVKSLSHLVASTWGPSIRHSRLLYTAVVKPTMLYGAQVWSLENDGGTPARSKIKGLQKIQKQALRKVSGAYKLTPPAAVERETAVEPLDISIEASSMKWAARTSHHRVTKEIAQMADSIWHILRRTRRARGKRRAYAVVAPRSPTPAEKLRAKAYQISQRTAEAIQLRRNSGTQPRRQRTAGGHQHQWKQTTLIDKWADEEWKQRWLARAEGSKETTWTTPWATETLKLYEGAPKHIATAILLLRTEVIGLNAWLSAVRVPGVSPRCACDWPEQTVRHVLMFCPNTALLRDRFRREARTMSLGTALSTPYGAQAAARLLVDSGLMAQFQVAKEVEAEDTRDYRPLPGLQTWDIG
jgi:hypothetical protein